MLVQHCSLRLHRSRLRHTAPAGRGVHSACFLSFCPGKPSTVAPTLYLYRYVLKGGFWLVVPGGPVVQECINCILSMGHHIGCIRHFGYLSLCIAHHIYPLSHISDAISANHNINLSYECFNIRIYLHGNETMSRYSFRVLDNKRNRSHRDVQLARSRILRSIVWMMGNLIHTDADALQTSCTSTLIGPPVLNLLSFSH